MKFNAAILIEQRCPLVLDQIELDSPLEYGQTLVKVISSGICGSQLGEIDGIKGEDKFLPHLLGHEGGGIVEEIGPGVSTVKPGDHVVMHWKPGAGIEAPKKHYRWGNKRINAGSVTTFNEYAVVSENRLTSIPKNIDLSIAALMGCSVLTGFGVVNNDAQVKIGQSLVIFGMGGVGLNVVQAASLVSAFPIVGVDLGDEKLALANKLGLDYGINSLKEENVAKKILSYVGNQGADVVIDTTGNARIIEMAYTLTNPDGKTILVGVPKKNDNISIHSLPLHFQKQLKGSHGGNACPEKDIPAYIRLIEAGKLQLDKLIMNKTPLNKINDAINDMRNGKFAGRILLTM